MQVRRVLSLSPQYLYLVYFSHLTSLVRIFTVIVGIPAISLKQDCFSSFTIKYNEYYWIPIDILYQIKGSLAY